LEVKNLEKRKTNTVAADYEWETVPSGDYADDGDSLYQALNTAKEDKAAELVRMMCNSA